MYCEYLPWSGKQSWPRTYVIYSKRKKFLNAGFAFLIAGNVHQSIIRLLVTVRLRWRKSSVTTPCIIPPLQPCTTCGVSKGQNRSIFPTCEQSVLWAKWLRKLTMRSQGGCGKVLKSPGRKASQSYSSTGISGVRRVFAFNETLDFNEPGRIFSFHANRVARKDSLDDREDAARVEAVEEQGKSQAIPERLMSAKTRSKSEPVAVARK